ncbi:phosphate signaling complex protein PhoU [Roseospira goensis]|uniref:Phosphate-specific transport system accessory protein PhoU n=1 Tax=Roseospira goensis TaxID=391922 RepID=A0A7W6RXW0_9PROT|nr:phosphate signaling complex protein PhoU [Roseospira goensis]MBB4284562.1 phosphate transport system protein [Roseospira goensis]
MADAPLPDPHIVRSFDAELSALDRTLEEMGARIDANLTEALAALADHDADRAAAVSAADAAVDALEQRVNEQAVRMLALRQPKADDLRSVVAGLRCATMLERAGDYAAGAARRGIAEHAPPPGRSGASVQRMGRMVGDLMRRSVRAYLTRDTAAAHAVWQADAEVDAVHSSLFRELLTYMMEDPRDIGVCSHLLFVAKNLERIGDQATNIAELACYRVTGETLGHARPKHDLTSFAGLDDRAAPPHET